MVHPLSHTLEALKQLDTHSLNGEFKYTAGKKNFRISKKDEVIKCAVELSVTIHQYGQTILTLKILGTKTNAISLHHIQMRYLNVQ